MKKIFALSLITFLLLSITIQIYGQFNMYSPNQSLYTTVENANLYFNGLQKTYGNTVLEEEGSEYNVYHPFPDSNAVWTVGWGDMSCSSSYQYEMKGDTLIGTVRYRKIEIKGERCYFYLSPVAWNSKNPYRGAIRQDAIAKKVYYILPDSTTEILLYDFNIQVGDTLKGFLAEISSCDWKPTIQSIDSILIEDGSYRKRYNYSASLCAGSIIEGIGNNRGLLEPFRSFEAGGELTCVTFNNAMLYHAFPWSSCTVSIKENPYEKHTVSVFPNPASNKLTIKFHANLKIQDIEITLYNILGEKVNANYSFLYQQEHPFEIKMDASCLHNGFYLLSIESKGQIIGKEKILITQ